MCYKLLNNVFTSKTNDSSILAMTTIMRPNIVIRTREDGDFITDTVSII